MAKVTGPLFSLDARGKLGKSLVFIGWKGIKDVRQWLTPANPQSAAQGNVRTVLGGIGRAVGHVDADAAFHTKLKNLEVIPDQQSKQSYLVQYIKDNFIAGAGATLTGNFVSILAELTGHTAYTSFSAQADTEGITGFSLDYDSIDSFEKGLGLYLLAKAAIALEFTGSPYTKTLSAWTKTQISKMVGHLST